MKLKQKNYQVVKYGKHGGIIIQEKSMTQLQIDFKEHSRLTVFAQPGGLVCKHCGLIGTRLILRMTPNGQKHWEVISDDLIPLTVDHILPRSKGGKNIMENYQTLCVYCNQKKGNNLEIPDGFDHWGQVLAI